MSERIKVDLLKEQIERSAETFQHLIAELPDDVLHSQPGGVANSIAATIGHVTTAMDGVINAMLQQETPLFVTMPTGLSEMPPGGDEFFNWHAWGTRVRLDLPVALAYADAVFASSSAYLDTISDADLDRTVESPASGDVTTLFMLSTVVLGNIANHAGEIAALKGIHGLRGYAV